MAEGYMRLYHGVEACQFRRMILLLRQPEIQSPFARAWPRNFFHRLNGQACGFAELFGKFQFDALLTVGG